MIEGKSFFTDGGIVEFRINREKSALSRLSLYGITLGGASLDVKLLDEAGSLIDTILTTSSDDDVVVDINKPASYVQLNINTAGSANSISYSYVERNG